MKDIPSSYICVGDFQFLNIFLFVQIFLCHTKTTSDSPGVDIKINETLWPHLNSVSRMTRLHVTGSIHRLIRQNIFICAKRVSYWICGNKKAIWHHHYDSKLTLLMDLWSYFF
jgi:hypothetical protein